MKKVFNSTATHLEHKDLEMKHEAVTLETIKAKETRLEKARAEFNHVETSSNRKSELSEEVKGLDQEIKFDREWLSTKCALGTMPSNKNARLIGKGDGFQITIND